MSAAVPSTQTTSGVPDRESADVVAAEVLFVDLDGTLIKSDLLWESYVQALRSDSSVLYKTFVWLARGRAGFKQAVAEAGKLDARRLPYREDVLEFLKQQRILGRRVVLATAAHRTLAEEIAQELALFDDILSSDGQTNLKGARKLAAIEAYCSVHGFNRFAYLADGHADLPIWRQSAEVHVVEPTARLSASLQAFCTPTLVFGAEPRRAFAMLRVMRPHQWVKNLLLFVPLLLAHQLAAVNKIASAGIAFLAFCACASAVYVLNDLLDVDADRQHPKKRRRPFASGDLPLAWGPPLATGLLALAFGMSAALLPLVFSLVLGVYLVATCLYTYWLKNTVMADVLTLAGLYTVRVFAGGIATDIPVSQWLMAFSLFLFTSLAFAKRHSELFRLSSEGRSSPQGRAYLVGDLRLIESLGPTSGYLAVLVLALYINSDAMKAVYANAWALWLVCPLLLYWISRVWFLSVRGQLPEDPVIFAVKDRVSLLTFAAAGLLLLIATVIH